MKKSLLILSVLAGFHLVLVGLGAAQLPFERLGFFGKVLNLYGELTGSGSGYGFFAPGVGYQLRAQFEVTDKEGKKTDSTLLSGANNEADLRTGNLIGAVSRGAENEKIRRAMVASWAGKIFGRYPEAREVVVKVESYTPVSVKQFNDGKRSEWKPYYKTRFIHEARAKLDKVNP